MTIRPRSARQDVGSSLEGRAFAGAFTVTGSFGPSRSSSNVSVAPTASPSAAQVLRHVEAEVDVHRVVRLEIEGDRHVNRVLHACTTIDMA